MHGDWQWPLQQYVALRQNCKDASFVLNHVDDFLEEKGLLAEAEAIAIKRVIAYQVSLLMDEQRKARGRFAILSVCLSV